MDLDEFRRLVDRTGPRLHRSMDAAAMAAAIGVDNAPIGGRAFVEILHEQIAAAFPLGRADGWRQCRRMASELVFAHLTKKTELEPYLAILERVRDGCRGQDDGEPLEGDWCAAVVAARDMDALLPEAAPGRNLTSYSDTVWNAMACIRLNAIGRSGGSASVEPHITPERHTAIIRHIERLASHVGGINISARLFAELTPTYDESQDRYHFVNHFYQAGLAAKEARLPANYMLQLAAKYPVARKPRNRGRKAWEQLRQLCIDYAALHGVQPVTGLWIMGRNPREHSHLLRELSLHDSLFTLQQVRQADFVQIAQDLLDGLQELGKLPATVRQEAGHMVATAKAIQEVARGRRGPVSFSVRALDHLVGAQSRQSTQTALDKYLAHPPTGANLRFNFPSEIPDSQPLRHMRTGADFANRPLLTIDTGRYLLLDGAACSAAYLEAFLALLRNRGIDEAAGLAAEHVVLRALQRRGLEPIWGTYTTPDGAGECDAVLESDKAVILFEVKKKALTASARAGLDLTALVDLTQSLVKATLQTGLQEYRLRKFGTLNLERNDGSTTQIAFGGRRILRIAVTLQDYGAFQDNVASEVLLSHHLAASFKLMDEVAEDTPLLKRVASVNAQSDELKALNNKLFEQAGKPERWRPYAHCWFLSVPQLLVLLDRVSDANGLFEQLRSLRGLVHGSRDFYYELHALRSLGSLPNSASS